MSRKTTLIAESKEQQLGVAIAAKEEEIKKKRMRKHSDGAAGERRIRKIATHARGERGVSQQQSTRLRKT